ncbi:aromatase/cyclase [Streptomyces justiciae]|uniref:Aromatase/cyclase n=1 Tax=Streptomyces justiciae TaxID=2780140 RepID=A0ABU3M7G2_9ACTN|nr:aromatase/cyclase [Streptomyces justiciae]MDT7847434.1 aromatase/cyclase [Streptomyces justiciae]
MSARHADHRTQKAHVSAPAGVVYALVADTVKWPLYYSPIMHVERQEFDGERERLRMWSLVGGELKSWTSWRRLDPVARCVEFRQEVPAPPLHSLNGTVQVRSEGPQDSDVEVTYGFSLAGDLAADTALVERIGEGHDLAQRRALSEVAALAERWDQLDELVLSFEESVRVDGPAELVYDFLYRAADWPAVVPHITRVDLTEDVPGVQRVTVETVTEDGPETTEAVRICFPHAGRIVYKTTATPALLEAHTGEWSVVPDEHGATVIAQHNVLLNEQTVATLLGENTDPAEARRQVREVIGRNSRALLAQAAQHAKNAVRTL